MGRVSSAKAVWRDLSQAGSVRGRVAGRHVSPHHAASEIHGHVAWKWQWLFTSISSEHTFLRQSARSQYFLEKVGISSNSLCAQFLLWCLWQSAGDLYVVIPSCTTGYTLNDEAPVSLLGKGRELWNEVNNIGQRENQDLCRSWSY